MRISMLSKIKIPVCILIGIICFAYGDFCLDVENEEGWIIKNSTWTTEMRIQKYSFLGDTEFSEEELEKYKDIMDKVNKSILGRL